MLHVYRRIVRACTHRATTVWCIGTFAASAASCARDAEPLVCPRVGEGELVLSEIRGPQLGTDTYGQWFELFNSTQLPIDLRGVQLRVSRLDGSGEEFLLVRSDEVELAPGDYAVLGHHDPIRQPLFVDYSFFSDYSAVNSADVQVPRSLYVDGIVEVHACGEVIDRVVYRDLPFEGTRSFDGNALPNAEDNDDERRWCPDTDNEPPPGPMIYIGIPGTPGSANRPCP